MHNIIATDFPLFCSNFARKCLILKLAYSARNSAGRIYPSLSQTQKNMQLIQTRENTRKPTLRFEKSLLALFGLDTLLKVNEKL